MSLNVFVLTSPQQAPEHEETEPPAKKPRIVRVAPNKSKSRVKAKAKPEPDSPEQTGPASLRLTRSATRSMNRVPARKQGGTRGGKKALQQRIEEEEEEDWGSDGEMGIPQRQRSLSVYQGDAPDNGSLSVGMRGSGRQGTQGKLAFFLGHGVLIVVVGVY